MPNTLFIVPLIVLFLSTLVLAARLKNATKKVSLLETQKKGLEEDVERFIKAQDDESSKTVLAQARYFVSSTSHEEGRQEIGLSKGPGTSILLDVPVDIFYDIEELLGTYIIAEFHQEKKS
jgi:hypothetical protein